MSDTVDYTGISEAELVNALYHGTRALGMGFLHHTPGLTVAETQADLDEMNTGEYPQPDERGRIYFDYYRGHPLKLTLDTRNKTFDGRLYDRDAGQGAAQAVVDKLKGK